MYEKVNQYQFDLYQFDYQVLSKTSNARASWECRKNSELDLHDQLLSTHQCSINTEGSDGSIEASGVVECFQRSLNKKDLRYTQYNEVVNSDPYVGDKVENLKCVDHIQKRLGTL